MPNKIRKYREKPSTKRIASIGENIKKWSQLTDCKLRFEVCNSAIDFIKKNGNFSIGTTKKNLKTAIGDFEKVFTVEVLIGILCQESSFGTFIPNKGENIKGPFQIGRAGATDYNNQNQDYKVEFPTDIDDFTDLEKAAQVGAWYYAYCLQQLTYKPAVKDPEEAKKMALASYNGGPTLITKARSLATDSGQWPSVLGKLKEADPKITESKIKEIKDYVINIVEYAKQSGSCWCKKC